MPVKCRNIMEAMERLAPKRFAADWDKIGLQTGNPEQDIECVMIALDVTETTITEAACEKAGMIIVHHPLIFKPLEHLCTDNPHGRMLAQLIKHDIAVYAAHTNLDVASGCVNDVLAEKLNLTQIRPLKAGAGEKLVKLVVFVPETHAAAVREAITKVGAGHIGNYSHCTFQTLGTGTFLPLEGTNPFLGRQGELEYAAEFRLETIMPEQITEQVIKAVLEAHPYEEVAYDLYPLLNRGKSAGLGRIGKLGNAMTLRAFASMVKERLGASAVRVSGDLNNFVLTVALCGGSGADLVRAAMAAGADVLVTGDIKYHEAQEALAAGIALIDAGHFFTERPVVETVASYIKQYAGEAGWNLRVITSKQQTDIFHFI